MRSAPFNALQQRLNRKKVTQAMLASFPAHIRLYDILFDQGEDIRALPLSDAGSAWKTGIREIPRGRMDLSPVLHLDE